MLIRTLALNILTDLIFAFLPAIMFRYALHSPMIRIEQN